MFRYALAALLAATLILTPSAAADVQPTFPDLVYAEIDGAALHMDLYLPAQGEGPVPVVLWIHGGGWLSGSRSPLAPYAEGLLCEGIAVAAVQYRLTNQDWQFDDVHFPAQIHDVKAAVRWLRANAGTYGLAPERIGAWGDSAGGHLAALLGTSGDVSALEGTLGTHAVVSSRVQAVVDYFGPTDLLHANPDRTWPPGGIDHDSPTSTESKLIGWTEPDQGIGDIRVNLDNPDAPYPDLVHRCLMADPITHASPDDPAHFILHGTEDILVPLAQSTKLHAALVAEGVAAEIVVVPGMGHVASEPVHDVAAIAFLRTILLPQTPDEDINQDEVVDIGDLLEVLGDWGPCATPSGCPCKSDITRDGEVSIEDLLAVLGAWSS